MKTVQSFNTQFNNYFVTYLIITSMPEKIIFIHLFKSNLMHIIIKFIHYTFSARHIIKAIIG